MSIHNQLKTFFVGLFLSQIMIISDGFATDTVNPALFANKEYRLIGPWRGGRAVAITGVIGDSLTYYMGATGGGVWKTTNGGTTWNNISDNDFNVGTIGSIAVSQSDSNVIYVGTGEGPIRGVTTSSGDGIYKSTDGGETWTHIGLPKAGQIPKIRIHPTNPDIAYAAVQGNIWGPSEERGIYRTRDGGATWEHVLKVSDRAGGGDLAMDPTNPRILYASLWENGRTPWYIRSGGDKGGIFKSVDGGDTWEKLSGGLPTMIGKVGVDVSASNPKRIYAVVEGDMYTNDGGVYRSDDAGKTWINMNPNRLTYTRAWYYDHIKADPIDDNTVYVMNVPFLKSIDAGKSYKIIDVPHGDTHDLWINPDNNLNMALADDGGATITFDGGKTWSSIMNQPTGQFYRVATDNMMPYRIYGGQQDNSTVAITSESFTGGIGIDDYYAVGGGESAHIAFDENNPRLVYASTINGTLTEIDTANRRMRPIKPYPEYVYGKNAKDLKYRTNWNAPVASSPHDPNIIYYGTQKILRSSDRGVTWEEISPDLTRNDKSKQGLNGGPLTVENVGAEFYGNVFYIVESPHEVGVIWSGSDDGLVQITRDNGATWTNVTPKGLPESQINAIEVSPHDAATAYIAVTGYKMNDTQPYIYKTTNYGKSWTRIDKDLPRDTFVRVVREDKNKKGLLYAGTESGMFISFDDGKNWQSLKLNLPPVPITDLTIRQGDLVVATQGRGFWVMDDIAIFSQISDEQAKEPIHIISPSPTMMITGRGSAGLNEGKNPEDGVVLSYHIADEHEGPLTIEILDSFGNIVRHYSSEESDYDRCVISNMSPRQERKLSYPSKNKGMNSWTWDMRREGIMCIDDVFIFSGFEGAKVMPGDYRARIAIGDNEKFVSFKLIADPRDNATPDEYAFLDSKIIEGTNLFNEIITELDRARKARRQIKALMNDYNGDDGLISMATIAINRIDEWEKQIDQIYFQVLEDEDAWPSMLDVQVKHVVDVMDGAGAPVAKGALQRLEDVKAMWTERKTELKSITDENIVPINGWAKNNNVSYVISP
ncbi:MAG: glycosyl hydrolase [Kordiimonadaceae bacterium]|nr:glycosyl hydrolase [Kordiimonadaceae bacterium]